MEQLTVVTQPPSNFMGRREGVSLDLIKNLIYIFLNETKKRAKNKYIHRT